MSAPERSALNWAERREEEIHNQMRELNEELLRLAVIKAALTQELAKDMCPECDGFGGLKRQEPCGEVRSRTCHKCRGTGRKNGPASD